MEEWAGEDGLFLLESWRRDGMTDEDISMQIGISTMTLDRWRKKNPDIARALRKGKEFVDYQVESALLRAALGYKTKEIKVMVGKIKGMPNTVELVKETIEKEVGPNPTACIMWLNNRKPDKWKRNRDRFEDANRENNFTIRIERGPQGEEDTNRCVTVSSNVSDADADADADLDYWPPGYGGE